MEYLLIYLLISIIYGEMNICQLLCPFIVLSQGILHSKGAGVPTCCSFFWAHIFCHWSQVMQIPLPPSSNWNEFQNRLYLMILIPIGHFAKRGLTFPDSSFHVFFCDLCILGPFKLIKYTCISLLSILTWFPVSFLNPRKSTSLQSSRFREIRYL